MINRLCPPPGSLEAIEMGCLCPSLDNGGGTGRLKIDEDGTEHRLFWISDECLLHGDPSRVTVTCDLTFEPDGDKALDWLLAMATLEAQAVEAGAAGPDVVTMS